MVIAQRVHDIEHMIQAGHDVHISGGYSQDSGRFKIKVKIGRASDRVPLPVRDLLLQSFTAMVHLTTMHTTVDRGHHFSNGESFAHFWITPGGSNTVPGNDTDDTNDNNDDDNKDGNDNAGDSKHDGAQPDGRGNRYDRDLNRKHRKNHNDNTSGPHGTGSSKKPRTHDVDQLKVLAGSGESTLDTSCSTVEHHEIHSDCANSDDESECSLDWANVGINAGVSVSSQTGDTIPPNASARLLVSPSQLFDVTMEEVTRPVIVAFSSLRSALLALHEEAPVSEVSLSSLAPPCNNRSRQQDDEHLSDYAEIFLPIRLQVIGFQYAYAEAMEYLDDGWAANVVATHVLFDLPVDEDHEDCQRLTNVCAYVGLRRSIELYSPFTTSASEITRDEATDAMKDYMYAARYQHCDQMELLACTRSKFSQSTTMPFLTFIALGAGDEDHRAPFWNDEIGSVLRSSI